MSQFLQNLNSYCDITKNDILIRYTKNNTLLYTKNRTNYINVLQYLKEENKNEVRFHTYTPKEEKTHAFVIRGLDNKPEPEEIITAFQNEHEIEIKTVYEMKTTSRPLYMIVTSSALTLKYLSQNIRYVMGIRIYIEERRNNRKVIQCRRCQQWGHATSNCFRQERCVRCAGEHLTKDCEKHNEGAVNWKCANCNGAHQANNIDCPIYQSKLSNLQNNREGRPAPKDIRQQQYIDAPPPERNAWTRHKDSRQEKTHQTQLSETSARNKYNSSDKQSQIQESQVLFAELDNLLNITEMNRALKDLIQKLKENNSAESKFTTYYNFIKSLSVNYEL